jgi:orotate phosphoribosyltransferase
MKLTTIDSYTAPSGRVLSRWDVELWLELESNGTFGWSEKEIPFNCGYLSHLYFSARNDLSENPRLLSRICAQTKNRVEKLPLSHGPQYCLIGIPTAGTQLAQGVSGVSSMSVVGNPPICFRTMRSFPKTHGKIKTLIEPPDLERHSYVTVENVITEGNSLKDSLTLLKSLGYPTQQMHHLAFASWELGGDEALSRAGYDLVHVMFYLPDIVALYVAVERWPHARYEDMVRRHAVWRAKHG